MIKKVILFIFLVYTKYSLYSYPFINDENCTTFIKKETTGEVIKQEFDSNTKVTFYGDSRMDFADLPFPYGLAGMFGSGLGGLDVFLGALPEGWNVQNFAVTGMTSGTHSFKGKDFWLINDVDKTVGIPGLYDHLLNCMRANGDNPPFPKTYKIARNVAFHIGGNDFIFYSPILAFMPWKFNDVKNLVLNNYEKIISIFIRRKRNILLIGHYPTVATSYVLGKPEDYYENNAFLKPPPLNELYKPNLFQLGIEGIKRLTNGNYLESKNKDTINNYIKELYKLTEKSLMYVNCTIASGILSLFQEELKFCKKLIFDKVIEKRIHDIKNTLELGGDRSDVPEWYLKWIYFVWNEGYPPSTIASLGLISVELELPEITSRRNLDAKNYGVEIHYLRLWQSFLNPHIPNEIWNVNPFLMGDRLHPNLYGFIIWGYHVGNKIRELGWHKDKFDVGLQGVKEEPPLLSQQDLNQINDSSPLPHENSSRPSDPEPNIIDVLILCYFLGCFK